MINLVIKAHSCAIGLSSSNRSSPNTTQPRRARVQVRQWLTTLFLDDSPCGKRLQ